MKNACVHRVTKWLLPPWRVTNPYILGGQVKYLIFKGTRASAQLVDWADLHGYHYMRFFIGLFIMVSLVKVRPNPSVLKVYNIIYNIISHNYHPMRYVGGWEFDWLGFFVPAGGVFVFPPLSSFLSGIEGSFFHTAARPIFQFDVHPRCSPRQASSYAPMEARLPTGLITEQPFIPPQIFPAPSEKSDSGSLPTLKR